MAKYKLAISIPTYERPECISELVDYMIDEAEKLNIGIYIFDGSEHNDDTQKALKKYKKYSCFNYIRHHGTVSKRHSEAIYKPDCEYILICRDRSVIKIDYWKIILKLLEDNYEAILLLAFDNPEQDHVKLYTNPHKLIQDFIPSMTFFGSYVVKKAFLRNIEYTNEDYMTNFALLYKFFDAAASTQNFKALYLPFNYNQNYFHIKSDSNIYRFTGNQYFEIWAKNWVGMIDALPDFYNIDKNKLKLIRSRDVWSFFYFVRECKHGSITFKDLCNYKKYIQQVTKIPWFIMVTLSILPRWIAHILCETIRPIYKYKKEKLIQKLKKRENG